MNVIYTIIIISSKQFLFANTTC